MHDSSDNVLIESVDVPDEPCKAVIVESLYDHAGGREAIHRFVDVFYGSVLADPVLQPLFGAGHPEHVAHLTAFDAESFGGPKDFSETVGFAHLIDAHRGLRITEPQRERFVELYLRAADAVGLPEDAPFREALRSHVEFGSHVAMQNSHADTDEQLHPLREVPLWRWPDQV
jgi:hemoglobin